MEGQIRHVIQHTPKDEIVRRLNNLRPLLEKASLDGAFFHYKIDFFYLSGTMQDAFLFMPINGAPKLFVKRELRRAKRESPLEEIIPFRSFSEITPYAKGMKRVGFQLDVAPYNFVQKFREYLDPDAQLINVSPLTMELRKYKSPFEISIMEKAAVIAKRLYEAVPHLLKEGMREIELGGILEGMAKAMGHEGLLRVRSMNYEAYTWHVLSGSTGTIVSQSDSPMGGLGLSPAFPVGASMKKMKRNEPILVDFGICYHGYQVDQTRMFAIGSMPEEFVKAYNVCKDIHYRVLDRAVAGASSKELFAYSVELADKAGYGPNFLGYAHHKVRFLGHGIGLELAEFPYIAQNHDYPIEPGAVFAIEPKMVFPRKGACGVENTVFMEKGGYRVLTTMDENIIVV